MNIDITRLNCVLGHRRRRVALTITLDSGRRAWCLFSDGPRALKFRDGDPLLGSDKHEWGYVVLSEEELARFFRRQSADLVACEPVPASESVDCVEATVLLEMLKRDDSEAELQSCTRADLRNSRRSDGQ